MTLILLLASVSLLALLPYLTEALRKPMDDTRRAAATGSFVELSQGLTHFDWHGPRSDRVLVLVHGSTAPAWIMQGLIRGLLMLHFRVLSYDLYGRGFSDRPAGAQDIGFFTRQLGELIDELGLRQPVTLLGYSLGGAVAAAWAAAEPDRVERLILLAPTGIGYRPTPFLRLVAARGRLGEWLWALAGGFHLARLARQGLAGPTTLPDLPERVAFELNTRGSLGAILSTERHALKEDLQPILRELAAMYIPTLAIWGAEDPVIPLGAMGQFTQWNRQARQEVIKGAGHGLVHTHPKEIIGAIHAFLREVPNV